ncbi:MAG: N-acetylneuraminate synthase family protein [Planctomycetes bacterium]|nr:N-acetylneuraminate synthase family protein [Planctomycetota bacterium]
MRTIGEHHPCLIVATDTDPQTAAQAGADAVIDADPAETLKAGLLLGVRVDASEEPLAGAADFLLLGDGEITNRPFIELCARLGLPTFMGTGGATLSEVTRAVGWFQLAFRHGEVASPARRRLAIDGGGNLVLLHGTLLDAPSDADHNLRAMQRMHGQSLQPVGFEDRSGGAGVAPLAVACGAIAVVRQYDAGFADMAAGVRRAETLLGEPRKVPGRGEEAAARAIRRHTVAAHDLTAGHVLTRQDVDFATPAPGENEFAPKDVDGILGRELQRELKQGEAVSRDAVGGDIEGPAPWFSPRPPKHKPDG